MELTIGISFKIPELDNLLILVSLRILKLLEELLEIGNILKILLQFLHLILLIGFLVLQLVQNLPISLFEINELLDNLEPFLE